MLHEWRGALFRDGAQEVCEMNAAGSRTRSFIDSKADPVTEWR